VIGAASSVALTKAVEQSALEGTALSRAPILGRVGRVGC